MDETDDGYAGENESKDAADDARAEISFHFSFDVRSHNCTPC
jgi:hypothetical protein